MQAKAFHVTKEALRVAHATDVPAIIRSLLRSITPSIATKVVSCVREETKSISTDLLALVFEVVCHELRVIPLAGSSLSLIS